MPDLPAQPTAPPSGAPPAPSPEVEKKLSELGIKKENPQKGKIITAVVALLLVLIAVPAGIYLIKQGQKPEEVKEPEVQIGEEVPVCKDGFNDGSCECSNAHPGSLDLHDSCASDGKYVVASPVERWCDANYHYSKFTVSKKADYSGADITIVVEAYRCRCDDGCGNYPRGDQWCACSGSGACTSEGLTEYRLPPGTTQVDIQRKVELPGGGCGATQIDVFLRDVKEDGQSKGCYFTDETGSSPRNVGAWSIWLTGLDKSQCVSSTPTPTPTEPPLLLCNYACNDYTGQPCDPDDPCASPLCCYSWMNGKRCRHQTCPDDPNCICDTTTGTPTPTPTPTPTITPTPTTTGSPTPTPTGFITPTPPPIGYELICTELAAWDENWQSISSFGWSNISAGNTVYFVVHGTCSEPQGITNARFRINEGEWLEPTGYRPTIDGVGTNPYGYYLEYTIPSGGDYKVEAMVYNPTIGWR